MNKRTASIIGWAPAILVGLFMILASGLPKFFLPAGTSIETYMLSLGAWDLRYILGVLEIGCTVLFLIPRTSTIGFVLLVGYLGGVLATVLTHPQAEGASAVLPIVILILISISAYFRTPELLSRLLGRPVPEKI